MLNWCVGFLKKPSIIKESITSFILNKFSFIWRCIWNISFIIGLEGQYQEAGTIFQVGEKAEEQKLYMSYKLWKFSELVSLLHKNFLFTSCKASCIGRVIIKQFVFVIGFEVLTAVSKKSEVFWVVTPFGSLCYYPEDHTVQFVFIVWQKLLLIFHDHLY